MSPRLQFVLNAIRDGRLVSWRSLSAGRVSHLSRTVPTFELDNRPGAADRRPGWAGQWRHASKYRARTENYGSLSPGVGPVRENCEAPSVRDCEQCHLLTGTDKQPSVTTHRVQVNNFTSWSS